MALYIHNYLLNLVYNHDNGREKGKDRNEAEKGQKDRIIY